MGRSLKKRKEKIEASTFEKRQKILKRMETTKNIVSDLGLEELLNIVKNKRVEIPDKRIDFRCSSTDLMAIHQVMKKKKIDIEKGKKEESDEKI